MNRSLFTPLCCALLGAMMLMMGCDAGPAPEAEVDLLATVGESLPASAGPWRAEGAPVSYTPEALYDYIDGHAEVYVAYGLRGAVAQRYRGPGDAGDIVVDVFELASAADAYGVFTHDQDGDEVAIGQGALFRYGWLSFWQGPCFVSIYAEEESAAAKAAVLELGEGVAEAIPLRGEPPQIVRALPVDGLVERSVRYLHHPTILAAHRPLSDDNILELGELAVAALARYQRQDEGAQLLLVSYANAAVAQRAANAFGARFLDGGDEPLLRSDGWYALSRVEGDGELLALILGADSRQLAEAILHEITSTSNGGRA